MQSVPVFLAQPSQGFLLLFMHRLPNLSFPLSLHPQSLAHSPTCKSHRQFFSFSPLIYRLSVGPGVLLLDVTWGAFQLLECSSYPTPGHLPPSWTNVLTGTSIHSGVSAVHSAHGSPGDESRHFSKNQSLPLLALSPHQPPRGCLCHLLPAPLASLPAFC